MSTDTSSRMPAPRTERRVTFERVPAPGSAVHVLSVGDFCFIVAPNSPFGLVSAKVVSISDDMLSATVRVTCSGHLPFVRGELYAGPLDIVVIARSQVIKVRGVTKISGAVVGMSDRLASLIPAQQAHDTTEEV